MGRFTLGEVRDESKDSRRSPRGLKDSWGGAGQVQEPSGRSGTGRRTFEEVQE